MGGGGHGPFTSLHALLIYRKHGKCSAGGSKMQILSLWGTCPLIQVATKYFGVESLNSNKTNSE